jgi:hypothetical protein
VAESVVYGMLQTPGHGVIQNEEMLSPTETFSFFIVVLGGDTLWH